MQIPDIQIIDEGRQIIGLAGSTLFGLEKTLAPYGREPHSVIGSSCIGASIVGGICNNSGGGKSGGAGTNGTRLSGINTPESTLAVSAPSVTVKITSSR